MWTDLDSSWPSLYTTVWLNGYDEMTSATWEAKGYFQFGGVAIWRFQDCDIDKGRTRVVTHWRPVTTDEASPESEIFGEPYERNNLRRTDLPIHPNSLPPTT